MLFFGYLLACLMGMTLGVLGAGGSLLTVPIWVYCFSVPPIAATGYSLGVVGGTALLGAVRYHRKGMVDIPAALTFMLPAMLMVHLTRAYMVPAIPDYPWGLLSKDLLIMLMFGLLMLTVALLMLAPSLFTPVELLQDAESKGERLLSLLAGSAGVGLVTGLVGAGGGFLIVPTLISLFRLPVKQAVGTSLAIIAANALTGFAVDISHGLAVNWSQWLTFFAVTLTGMTIGTTVSHRLPSFKLQKLFGWFVLITGILVTLDTLIDIILNKF